MITTKEDSRYPYTYACDWLRACGLADSRSDAAQLYDGYEEACSIADEYLIHANLVDTAESFRQTSKKRLEEIYET